MYGVQAATAAAMATVARGGAPADCRLPGRSVGRASARRNNTFSLAAESDDENQPCQAAPQHEARTGPSMPPGLGNPSDGGSAAAARWARTPAPLSAGRLADELQHEPSYPPQNFGLWQVIRP